MQEAWAMLARLEGMKVLVAKLLWRSGLRLMKAFRLRVHDLDRNRQTVARISEELGIHVITLYKWRKTWRLQGAMVPASEKDLEGWSAADKFKVVLETAGLNATELSAYCQERGLFFEQVSRWRQTAQDAYQKPVLTLKEQKELERLSAQDQRKIKALKKELQRKEKALAKAAALLVLRKKWEAFCSEDEEG